MDSIQSLDLYLTLKLNGSSSLFFDGFAMFLTKTTTWLPFAIAFTILILKSNKLKEVIALILSISLCILLADQIASGVFKPLVERFRPSHDLDILNLIDVVDGYRGGKYGFFSSHASNTFALAIFSSLLIKHTPFTLSIFSWALLNAWTRVYLGVHYVGDLLVGSICGCIVGFLVYALYKKAIGKTHQFSNMSIQTSSGYIYSEISLCISILLLTYLACIIAGFCYM